MEIKKKEPSSAVSKKAKNNIFSIRKKQTPNALPDDAVVSKGPVVG